MKVKIQNPLCLDTVDFKLCLLNLFFSNPVIISAVNCYSLKLASKIMTILTGVKILAVIFIVLVGVVFMIKRRSFPESFSHPFDTVPGLETNVSSFTLSLYSVLWAYNGW